MRFKQLLTKTLLVAAGLCVGATSTWGQVKVTETYDFATFVSGGLSANPVSVTLGTNAHTHAKSGTTVKVVNNPTNNEGTTLNLNGRIAADPAVGSKTSGIAWRQSGNAYQNGLAGRYNTAAPTSGYYAFSILNLKADDEVTITYSVRSQKSAELKFGTINAKLKSSGSAVTADANITSGAKYVITNNGPLDFYSSNDNFAIQSIVIETTGTESIDAAPVIRTTGANGGDRTITITGSETNAGNSTKTYYTKDGSTPTSASTLYSAPFTITSSDADGEGNVTIKAITYKDGNTSIASEVTTQVVSVGTTLSLAAITSTLSNMAAVNGVAYPVYTFANNNSGVIGTPVSTLSATFTPEGGSASAATLTSNTYTFAQKGTLTVTAHADGYNDVNTSVTVSDSYIQNRTLNLAECEDFTAVNTLVTLGQQENWQIRADQGVYNNNSGNRDVTLVSASAGEIALFYYYNKATPEAAVKYSSNISWSMPRYNTLEKIVVYSVSDATATIGSTGWTTFASPYALDLSSMTASEGEVTAYYASAVDGENVTMTSTESSAVAAGEGIMLKGTAGATITIPVVASGSTISGNKLVGCTTSTVLGTNPDYYVLANNDGTAEFQRLDTNGATIPAGKAYLNASGSGAKSLTIVFDNETLGISDASLRNGNAEGMGEKAIYNLSGQRIAAPQKGINIIGGRKVVVK